MTWTDERIEQLKSLWTEGLSATQIALVLGGMTRNAVIGKVHRLRLAAHSAPNRVYRPRLPAAPKVKTKPLQLEPERVCTSEIRTNEDALLHIARLEASHDGVPFGQIRAGQCLNPIGTGEDGETLRCGKSTDSRRRTTCKDCDSRLRQPNLAAKRYLRGLRNPDRNVIMRAV